MLGRWRHSQKALGATCGFCHLESNKGWMVNGSVGRRFNKQQCKVVQQEEKKNLCSRNHNSFLQIWPITANLFTSTNQRVGGSSPPRSVFLPSIMTVIIAADNRFRLSYKAAKELAARAAVTEHAACSVFFPPYLTHGERTAQ